MFIKNMLRGGITTDDDSYPESMLMESIVTTAAQLIDEELQQRYAVGLGIDPDLMVEYGIEFDAEDVETEEPVQYLRAPRPATAQWLGNAAIKHIKMHKSPALWATAEDEGDALILAKGRAYYPPQPAFWPEGEDIRAVLPLNKGLARKARILYLPDRLDTDAAGEKLDIHADIFPLPTRMWEKVWRSVFQSQGGILIKTSENRDEVNNGADTTVIRQQA